MHRFLPDTNVWLALTLSGHPFHEAAVGWLDDVDGRGTVVMCRATQQSVLRLLTTAAIFRPLGDEPLANTEAWAVVDALLADDRMSIIAVEPPRAGELWRRYTDRSTTAPKVWMDGYLAGFAAAAGATLVTCDTGFRAYADLELVVLER